jgi:hypothetical protein
VIQAIKPVWKIRLNVKRKILWHPSSGGVPEMAASGGSSGSEKLAASEQISSKTALVSTSKAFGSQIRSPQEFRSTCLTTLHNKFLFNY